MLASLGSQVAEKTLVFLLLLSSVRDGDEEEDEQEEDDEEYQSRCVCPSKSPPRQPFRL